MVWWPASNMAPNSPHFLILMFLCRALSYCIRMTRPINKILRKGLCGVHGEVIKCIAASTVGSRIAHTGDQLPCCQDTRTATWIDSCGEKTEASCQ